MALDGSGYPFVAYYDCSSYDLYIARRDGLNRWTRECIESAGYTGYYPSLVIGEDGTIYIAYYNSSLNQLRMAYGGFGHWTVEIVDSTNYPGFVNTMRIDPDGRLHISHMSGTGTDIRYAVREGPNQWRNEIVASAMYVTPPGLSIDPDGVPCICFGDMSSDLKYARRVDGKWSVESIPTGLSGSIHARPEIGIDGCPYVALANDRKDTALYLACRPGEEWQMEHVVSGVYGALSFWPSLGVNGHLGVVVTNLDDMGLLYAETSIAVTTSPPADFLNPIWNWLSFPVLPVPPYTCDPASIFGESAVVNRFFRYDPVGKTMELYPQDFTEFEIGRGYILWAGSETYNPAYTGLAGPNPAEIAVPEQGGMWIGQPHNSPTGLAAMSVRDDMSGNVRTATEDAASPTPWLNWNFVYLDPYVDTYRISALAGGDDDSMRPWYGYRIWSFKEDLTLIVPRE